MKFPTDQTKGVNFGEQDSGFTSLEPSKTIETTVNGGKDSLNNGFTERLKDVGSVILAFADKVDFAALIVSVVGYIVISAFGGLKTVGEFFRYLLFLGLAFVIYWVISASKSEKVKFSSERTHQVLIAIIVVLMIVLAATNLDFLTWLWSELISTLASGTPQVSPTLTQQ